MYAPSKGSMQFHPITKRSSVIPKKYKYARMPNSGITNQYLVIPSIVLSNLSVKITKLIIA